MKAKLSFKDCIKLPYKFDVKKLQAEINTLEMDAFEYYKVIPLRAPAHLVDTSLSFPPPSGDYADGSWTDWMNTSYLEKLPYIKSIVDKFSKLTTVNLVRLLFLEPNAVVKEHTDPTLALEEEKSMVRLTIPIDNNDDVAFYLNDGLVTMKEGECWYLRLTDPHRVLNNGNTNRVNLTIDMIPNDKIIEIINKSQ